jgi:hypothetical protein
MIKHSHPLVKTSRAINVVIGDAKDLTRVTENGGGCRGIFECFYIDSLDT